MEIANLSFLIPALACVAAIIALYVSQPQRPRLALVSAFFMILIAGWQGYDSYQEWGTRQTVEKYAYSRLESTTRNTLGLLSQILRGANDGWLPTMTMSSSQIEQRVLRAVT
jgi:hypothetical protein